jgi:APA family basic amino acid/polyamine antiporter
VAHGLRSSSIRARRGERLAGEVNDPQRDAAMRLARRLGLTDALVIGLGSMIGAGVFAAIGPAARAAGSGLLAGLAIAAAVAYCNATSSAELAATYPASGGTYLYGRERLGHFWGYLARWGFVVGKTASCAAMALTVGAYAAPSLRRPIAVGAVLALTAINYRRVRKTALLTRVLVVIVLAALGLAVAGALFGGHAATSHFDAFGRGGIHGVLESAGLLFFAFAGYARIATPGEEVTDPARTIPKAIPVALAITLVVYATVAVSVLAAVGPTAGPPLMTCAHSCEAWTIPVRSCWVTWCGRSPRRGRRSMALVRSRACLTRRVQGVRATTR